MRVWPAERPQTTNAQNRQILRVGEQRSPRGGAHSNHWPPAGACGSLPRQCAAARPAGRGAIYHSLLVSRYGTSTAVARIQPPLSPTSFANAGHSGGAPSLAHGSPGSGPGAGLQVRRSTRRRGSRMWERSALGLSPSCWAVQVRAPVSRGCRATSYLVRGEAPAVQSHRSEAATSENQQRRCSRPRDHRRSQPRPEGQVSRRRRSHAASARGSGRSGCGSAGRRFICQGSIGRPTRS